MSPRKKAGAGPAATEDAALERAAPPEPPDDDIDDPEIERAISELGDDVGRIVLFRYPPEGGRRYYCGSMGAGEFSLDAVKQEYGGGKFHIRVQNSHGEYKASAYVTIDPRAQPRPVVHERATPASSGADGTLAVVLARILERLDRPPVNAGPVSDPMELAAKLGNVAAQQTASMVALVTGMMSKVKGGDGGGDPLAWLKIGLELARENNGGGGGDSYAPVLESLGKPLLEILLKGGASDAGKTHGPGMGAAAGNGPAVRSLPRPAAEGAAPAGAAEVSTGPEWIQVVRPFVPQLIARALKGSSPERLAWDLEEDHPAAFTWLRSQLIGDARDTFINGFFTAFPDANNHRAWFLDLFSAVGADPETDDGDEAGGPALVN